MGLRQHLKLRAWVQIGVTLATLTTGIAAFLFVGNVPAAVMNSIGKPKLHAWVMGNATKKQAKLQVVPRGPHIR